ncbi:MAG: hypothetical protein QNJ00_10145 [Woeseiaceae bacterium]|nr:hypothetical protein [Woeseiaceae bacterium]
MSKFERLRRIAVIALLAALAAYSVYLLFVTASMSFSADEPPSKDQITR